MVRIYYITHHRQRVLLIKKQQSYWDESGGSPSGLEDLQFAVISSSAKLCIDILTRTVIRVGI